MLAGGHDLVLDNLLRLDGVRRVERAQFLRGRRLRAYGGQDGAGGQRATAWESSSVGQHRAASAQQLTITFIDFRRVPSIAGPDFSVPLQETAKLHTGFVSESSKFFSLSYNKKANIIQY